MSWTAIVAAVLAIVRLVEAIFQWWNKDETKGALAALLAILKNFVSIETYFKK